MPNRLSRRRFLQTTALAGAAGLSSGLSLAADKKPPASERLAVGVIGVAGQGEHDWKNIAAGGAEIVAWCDVDENRTKTARAAFPHAKFYADFRRLLDQKGLDAVLVATPDHTHAPATLAALRRSARLLRKAVDPHGLRGAAGRRDGRQAQTSQANGYADPRRRQLSPRRRVDPVRRDRRRPRGACLGRHLLQRRRSSQGDAQGPGRSALGPVAGACSRAAISSRLRAVLVARLVGLRRRCARRHGLPSHGPALLGLEAAPSDEGHRRRAASARGEHPARALFLVILDRDGRVVFGATCPPTPTPSSAPSRPSATDSSSPASVCTTGTGSPTNAAITTSPSSSDTPGPRKPSTAAKPSALARTPKASLDSSEAATSRPPTPNRANAAVYATCSAHASAWSANAPNSTATSTPHAARPTCRTSPTTSSTSPSAPPAPPTSPIPSFAAASTPTWP